MVTEATGRVSSSHRAGEVLWLIVLIAALGFGYYRMMDARQQVVDRDNYRIMFEAANSLANKLEQLNRLYQSSASESRFKALFPGYRNTAKHDSCSDRTRSYSLSADKLLIYCGSAADTTSSNSAKVADISRADVLPSPGAEFSQFLFVDDDGQLLAQTGAERTVSFADMKAIMRQLKLQKAGGIGALFSQTPLIDEQDPALKMPSYSRHTEMQLSYGSYRIYLYPINLPAQHFTTDADISHRLYLVGLMPVQPLTARQDNIWNGQLLLMSLISLIFIWSFLKLYLMPKNQAILRWFSLASYLVCFSFFCLLLALLLSSFITQMAAIEKAQAAKQYSQQLQQELTRDLFDAFSQLQQFQAFFQQYYLKQLAVPLPYAKVRPLWPPLVLPLEPFHPFQAEPPVGFQHDSAAIAGPCVSKYGAKIAYFHQQLHVTLSDERCQSVSYLTGAGASAGARHNSLLLTVTAVDGAAKSSLPSFYLREHNTRIGTFDLSHRAYFQRVRQGQGWDLQLRPIPQTPVKLANSSNPLTSMQHNVYVQRLLNVDDGTRGTTISMPLFSAARDSDIDYGVILLADVLLPSMNYQPAAREDFRFMVVERSSGNMLYHSDNSRTFVENLYYAGPDGGTLKAAIQLDQRAGPIVGDYHGQRGRFVVSNLVVDEWALVVFYPDNSLRIYGFVWFAIFALTIALTLLGLALLIWPVLTLLDTGVLKHLFRLPKTLRRRWLFSAVLLSVSACCSVTGAYVSLQHLQPELTDLTRWLGLATAWLLLTAVIWWLLRRCFVSADSNAESRPSIAAAKTLLLSTLISLPAAWYLLLVKDVPYQALNKYYQQVSQLELKRDKAEHLELASQLFPNSLTQRRLTVEQVLPQYQRTQQAPCQQQSVISDTVIALPALNALPGHRYFWQTMLGYLTPANSAKAPPLAPQCHRGDGTKSALWPVLALLIGIAMLMIIFMLYIERILGGRLALASVQLKYLAQIALMQAHMKIDRLSNRLLVNINAVNLNGCSLTTLLMQSHDAAGPGVSDSFNSLRQLSPYLQQAQPLAMCFANIKLAAEFCRQSGALEVTLSDIEVSLEQQECRKQLLCLIQELKALTLSGKIARLTVFSGFHTLQRLTVKDSLHENTEPHDLAHTEYLAWAECLMDFTIVQPEAITQGHDAQLLHLETRYCAHLRQLVQADGYQLPEISAASGVPEPVHWRDIWPRRPDPGAALKLQTYLLNHADALYRFKWENCTHDEQLALYHLAMGNQLNPLNLQMIKNLALNGLVQVSNGRLQLMNDSFRQFVLNAEPQEQLKRLVKQGQAGFWQRHRYTLAVVVLLLIAGIALTSGQSVHIIAASIAGVLGTIVSVFSNASLLQGHMRT